MVIMQTITNKFLIMNNCTKCDTEGLVSNCCNATIHFMAIGAAKCSKCKKFTKLKPCDSCKEENSIQVFNHLLPNTIPQSMSKYQKILILLILISYLLLFFVTYLLMYK